MVGETAEQLSDNSNSHPFVYTASCMMMISLTLHKQTQASLCLNCQILIYHRKLPHLQIILLGPIPNISNYLLDVSTWMSQHMCIIFLRDLIFLLIPIPFFSLVFSIIINGTIHIIVNSYLVPSLPD